MPQDPSPPRQQSRPSVTVDAVVGAARSRAASDDHVRPELARKGTLPGIAGYRSPPIPPAPTLPAELAATQPPPEVTTRQTRQRPPAPSTLRQATPPALPRPEAWDSGYGAAQPPRPGGRETADEPLVATSDAPTSAAPSPSPLPPPSSTPEEASARARDRARDKAVAELDRERRERQKLELQLEIERERAQKSEPPAKPWIDERLVKALVGLLTALTALGTPLGIWLTAKANAAEAERARQERSTKEATATANSAQAASGTATKELEELRKQLAAERAYNREVWRRMGVSVPKRQGDPDPPQLDVEVPLRKPGTVTPGVILIVKTPPP